MRRHDDTSARVKPRRALVAAGLAALCAVALSGCSPVLHRGFLPKGVTKQSLLVERLWVNGWIAALCVGVLVWGLIIWSVIRYRRRKDDIGLPVQMRYNVPIEILYTVVPVFMIAVFFTYTQRYDVQLLDTSKKPDLTVNVVGKQWSWDFNYVEPNTYEAGTQAELTGKPGVEKKLPTMWLPVDKRVEFVLTSRDVIHSFWVPQFLMKMDIMPGRVNKFAVNTTETGTFQGKCAELCGAYHSAMLFNVKVVPEKEFQQHMAKLKAEGNVGQLPTSLGRSKLVHGEQKLLPKSDRSK
ncbi:cytochrome c oxidase subunit II [Segeticoccus sp.]|uniref:aa3-type cytochrome oxidase subunit II n=1 Tax=Segeticoccus sp. TaxID=2706531 RepID=UPI0039C9855C